MWLMRLENSQKSEACVVQGKGQRKVELGSLVAEIPTILRREGEGQAARPS